MANLKDIKTENHDQTTGVSIILRALEEPLRQIVTNCGGEASVVVNRVKEGTGAFGYNARTDVFEDLFESGVIDPTKVSRVALENAASVSGLLLTTEATIVDKPEENAGGGGGHGHPDMGGMGGMGGMM